MSWVADAMPIPNGVQPHQDVACHTVFDLADTTVGDDEAQR